MFLGICPDASKSQRGITLRKIEAKAGPNYNMKQTRFGFDLSHVHYSSDTFPPLHLLEGSNWIIFVNPTQWQARSRSFSEFLNISFLPILQSKLTSEKDEIASFTLGCTQITTA